VTAYEITVQWSGAIPTGQAATVIQAVADAIADYGDPGAEHVWTKVRGQYTITRVNVNPVPIAVLATIIIAAIAAIVVMLGIVLIAYWWKEMPPEGAALGLGTLIVAAVILYMLKERK